MALTRSPVMVRPGVGYVMAGRRGGFFKSLVKGIGKVVSTVAKVPVVGTIAKAAITSLPVVGQVVTAVGAVKKLTASGVAPTMNLAQLSATPGPSTPLAAQVLAGGPRRRKPAKRAKRAKKRKRPTQKRASSRGTAKQRAARARFARAAKRGRIKKGQRL